MLPAETFETRTHFVILSLTNSRQNAETVPNVSSKNTQGSYKYTHNIHTIYTQIIQSTYTQYTKIHTQYTHKLYNQHTHNTPKYTHNIHTIHTKYTHNTQTIYTRYTQNTHTIYTLLTLCIAFNFAHMQTDFMPKLPAAYRKAG
jgi:hypothetical protein